MVDITSIIPVTCAFVVFMVGCAIGALIETKCNESEKRNKPHADNRYWIKGDGVTENFPLPYSWTLSDAYYLRDLLRDKYMVGCVILYGEEGSELIEL